MQESKQETIRKQALMHEGILSGLAVYSAIVVVLGAFYVLSTHSLFYRLSNYIVSGLFLLDFLFCMALAPKKWRYVKNHVLDIVACLPLFPLAALARLVHIYRYLVFRHMRGSTHLAKDFLRIRRNTRSFLKTNGFIYMLYIFIGFVLLSSFLILLVEHDHQIRDFGDAVWWTIVTAATVGYGDTVPITETGRVIGGIVIIVGLSFVSMLTGTIATYFTKKSLVKTGQASREKQEFQALYEAAQELTPKQLETLVLFAKMQKKGPVQVMVTQPADDQNNRNPT